VKPYKRGTKTERRPTRTKNTIGSNVRAWLQLPNATVTVALGHPNMDNKTAIPEPWEVGHLPVYFGWGANSLALTDLTEEELDQLQYVMQLAINAARPVCKILDEKAYQVLQSGAELDEVPKRILRGRSPQLIRSIDTVLNKDPWAEDDEGDGDEVLSTALG